MEPRLQDEVQQIIFSTLKTNLHAALEELGKIWEDETLQPLTYNHYFTDNIQKDRLQDVRDEIKKAIEDNEKVEDYSSLKQGLKNVIRGHLTEVDMQKQACKEARSALDAYYKV